METDTLVRDTSLTITYRPVMDLVPYKNNPRTHSAKQITQIVRSITNFGFTNPVLVDDSNNIVAGHGRVAAAKQLGLKEVPTVSLRFMSEAQKRAYIIADNKLAENAGWDHDLLRIELGGLLEFDNMFDLTLTGFDTGEIDFLLLDDDTMTEEAIPEPPLVPVSVMSDLWQLGPHRILCGDALKSESYALVLGHDKAQLVFTDPPYNVKIDGHVCGNGSVKHAEFAMASGEMSKEQFTNFLSTVISQLINHTTNGSLHYLCMDWRHMEELLTAGNQYTELKNLCVWNKTTGGMGSLYRSQHELVFLFKNGTDKHINNVELGKNGRYRTNVWDYPGVNNFKNTDKSAELAMHPTVKPVQMISDAIMDTSHHGDLVLDCFGGSGSTLIAAHQTNRKAALIELDPRYVDVTIERFQRVSGIKAICSVTGRSYDDRKQEITQA